MPCAINLPSSKRESFCAGGWLETVLPCGASVLWLGISALTESRTFSALRFGELRGLRVGFERGAPPASLRLLRSLRWLGFLETCSYRIKDSYLGFFMTAMPQTICVSIWFIPTVEDDGDVCS